MVASCSTSSSSSSSSSSSGHCQREEKDMGKFEPLHLHHTPPPPPRHRKVKKHHRHRHHSYPPPPPPSHGRHHSVEHPDRSPPMDFPPHHHLSAPMDCPHHHPYKKDKLRVKPSKHLKKVHKLHRKLLKAHKLPHGGHLHHHMHFPPPKKGFSGTQFRHYHPPGCCLHSMGEEWSSMEEPFHCRREMGLRHGHHPQHHGHHPHPPRSMHPLIKSEVAGGKVAAGSPRGMEVCAKPHNEGEMVGVAPPSSDAPPVDEPIPIVQAL